MRHEILSYTRFTVDSGRFNLIWVWGWIGGGMVNGLGIRFWRRCKERTGRS